MMGCADRTLAHSATASAVTPIAVSVISVQRRKLDRKVADGRAFG